MEKAKIVVAVWTGLFCTLASVTIAGAQPVTEVWSDTYTGVGPSDAHGVAVYNGAVYVAGETTTGSGDNDMFLLKYDLAGNPIWERTWGGSNYDIGGKIAQFDNHLYVVGDSISYAFDPVGGRERDGITVKWSEDGVYDTTNSAAGWFTRFSGWSGYYGIDGAGNVVVDGDGSLYTVGRSEYSGNNFWTYVEKYDSNGVRQWQEHYGTIGWGHNSQGGGLTLSGGYVYASGAINDGSGDFQLFVLKYSTTGTPVWVYTWGNGATSEGGASVVVLANDIYVAGTVGSGSDPNGSDLLLVKLHDEGSSVGFVDSTTLATTGNDGATALRLVDGTLYVVGYTDAGGHLDSLLAAYDTDLNLLWDYSWGGTGDADDIAFDLALDQGIIYVAGMENGYTEAYVIAFAPAGQTNPPVAHDQAVTTDEDTPVAITLTASDVDGDALTFGLVDLPSQGDLSGVAPDLTYTPDAGYNGPDSFTFSANDGTVDSNIATVSITVHPTHELAFYLDIKPGSCPNPLNRKSRGVLPVAVLGTEEFDVSDIDTATIQLTRDSVEGGVAPIRTNIEDVGTPFEGELCECHDLSADGFADLTLKFRTQEVVAALALGSVPGGEFVRLTITGSLHTGEQFEASDCVWFVPAQKTRNGIGRGR